MLQPYLQRVLQVIVEFGRAEVRVATIFPKNVSGKGWSRMCHTAGCIHTLNECSRKSLTLGVPNGGLQPYFQQMLKEIVDFGCAKRPFAPPLSMNVTRNRAIRVCQTAGCSLTFNECFKKSLNSGVANDGLQPYFQQCFAKSLNLGVPNGRLQPYFRRVFYEIFEFGCATRRVAILRLTNVS